MKTNDAITLLLGLGLTVGCGPQVEDDLGDDTMAEGASEAGDDEPADTDGEGETEPEDGEQTDGSSDTEGEEPVACTDEGSSQACLTAEGEDGTQFCAPDYSGVQPALAWGPCLTSVVCEPGESRSCGFCPGGGDESGGEDCEIYERCDLYGGVPDWDTNQDEWGGCNTPLVLSFDGSPARMTAAGAATFDLDGVGGCITTDWPEAATPWLALDRDGNGSIDSGRELFGSGTRLASGARAPHGFAALAELDTNGDGRITPRDERFGELVLWADHDGDRRSTFAETESLVGHRILSIELGFRIERQCDERGNCGVERASFTFVDRHGAVRQGEVVDLHLACQ